MGMFDYIVAICPNCDAEMLDQTKDGPCCLNVYTVSNVMSTEDALIVDKLTMKCTNCKKSYTVNASVPQYVDVNLEEI